MTAAGVLAIFAVVFIQDASTLTCKKTTVYADINNIQLTDETCTTGVTACSRPILLNGAYKTGETWGCDNDCTNKHMCLLCTEDNCNTKPIKCKTGSSASSVTDGTNFCEDTRNGLGGGPYQHQGCIRPKKSYTTWNAGVNFACDVNSNCNDDTCAFCEDKDFCNDPTAVANETPADFKCFAYTFSNSKFTKGAATQCKGYDDSVGKCNSPKAGAVDGSGIYNTGCGPCDSSKTSVCAECTASSCNDIPVCFTNEANTASELCRGETKCKRPLKSYGGYASGEAWGCGACASGNANCKDCDSGDECNAKVVSKTSKCYTYKWDTDKFVMGDSAVCDRGENAAITCNMPKDAVKKEDYTTLTGCGPCKTGEKCEVCAEEECNSAAMKTATALLFALLYIMI